MCFWPHWNCFKSNTEKASERHGIGMDFPEPVNAALNLPSPPVTTNWGVPGYPTVSTQFLGTKCFCATVKTSWVWDQTDCSFLWLMPLTWGVVENEVEPSGKTPRYWPDRLRRWGCLAEGGGGSAPEAGPFLCETELWHVDGVSKQTVPLKEPPKKLSA